jgi:hypothetical protein
MYPQLLTSINNRHTAICLLDDLGNSIYTRDFSNRLHEGFVSPMIRRVNPRRPLHTMLGG